MRETDYRDAVSLRIEQADRKRRSTAEMSERERKRKRRSQKENERDGL